MRTIHFNIAPCTFQLAYVNTTSANGIHPMDAVMAKSIRSEYTWRPIHGLLHTNGDHNELTNEQRETLAIDCAREYLEHIDKAVSQ